MKRFWCWLVGHDARLHGHDHDDTLYYRCKRCGQTFPYYF